MPLAIRVVAVTAAISVVFIAASGLTLPGTDMGKAAAKSKTGKVRYEPTTFAGLSGWQEDNHLAALRTFQRSCSKLVITIRNGGRTGKIATPVALLAVCDKADELFGSPNGLAGTKHQAPAIKPTRKAAKAFFETHFTPHRVVHSGPRSVLTGYYEPVLVASRRRHGKFQTPVYNRPADLVNLVAEADRASVGRRLTHARKTSKGLQPYATRAEIEQGALEGKGLELLYFKNSVDVFFLHIQGSGRIKLDDGSSIRITYDGKNGHPYSSVGRHLIRSGVIGARSMSLQALGKWLKADPERGNKAMWHNKSFVFFRELKGAEAAGAHGVMNVQLTPGRSLAIDSRYHAMGLPIYVSAPRLRHVAKGKGFHRLMVGQDVGSAIKGPERGDIYFGSGARAGRLAGVTKVAGTFYVLLPKDDWSTKVEAGAGRRAPK